jgi:SMC interacting uncharacterized protein involved in chromosome segregation
MQLLEEVIQEVRDEAERIIAERTKEARDGVEEFASVATELANRAAAIQLNDGELSPDTPVGEGEVVLGVLPKELCQVDVARCQMIDEINAQLVAIREKAMQTLQDTPVGELGKKLSEMTSQLDPQKRRLDLASSLFWKAVHKVFPQAQDDENSGGVGIRENWQVVKLSKSEKCDCDLCTGRAGLLVVGGLPGMSRR